MKKLANYYTTGLLCVLAALYFAISSRPARALELQYPPIPGIGQPGETLNSIDQISLGQLAQFIFAAALWLAGAMALGVLLYVGFMFATTGTNPWKRLAAREKLVGLLVGVIILLGLYIFVGFLNPELLTLQNRNFRICNIDAQGKSTCQISFPRLPLSAVPGSRGGGTGGGGGGAPPKPAGVYLYRFTEFSGPSGTITYLSSSDNNLDDNEIKNNDASSSIISGNGTFTFYDDTNYGGAWVEIKRTGSNLECRTSIITNGQNELCNESPRQLHIRSDGLLYVHLREIAFTRDGLLGAGLCLVGCSWEDKIESVKLEAGNNAPGIFACPIPSNCNSISTRFGDPGTVGGVHNAVDIACPSGNEIRAPFGGTVTESGTDSGVCTIGSQTFNGFCGYHVVVSTPNPSGGYWTAKFCHMQTNLQVSTGNNVAQGDILGYSDNSGCSTGPHVHICLQKKDSQSSCDQSDSANVNPQQYLNCTW